MRLKPLLPTLKEKKRYVVFEVISDKPVSLKSTIERIKNGLLRFNGELEMANAGLIFLNDWKKQRGIMKVNHNSVDNIKAGLTFIKEIDNNNAIIRCLTVSGILNKARNYV